eukprot:4078379-Prymnesium_polylepis.1
MGTLCRLLEGGLTALNALSRRPYRPQTTGYSKGSSLRNRLTEIRLAYLSSISHAILEIRAGAPQRAGARKSWRILARKSKKFRVGRQARFHPQNQKSGRATPPDPDFYRSIA